MFALEKRVRDAQRPARRGACIALLISELMGMCTPVWAQSPIPEGTLGWTYMNSARLLYASDPVTACKSWVNPGGFWGMLSITPVDSPIPAYGCLLQQNAFSSVPPKNFNTYLQCAPGYEPRFPGVCRKDLPPPPPPTCTVSDPGFGLGNPVTLSSGAKVQREIDLQANQSGSLQIERTYRSDRVPGSAPTAGYVWAFSFERFVIVTAGENGSPPSSVSLVSADGVKTDFKQNGTRYLSSEAQADTLVPLSAAFDEWIHTNSTGRVDQFKKSGLRYLLVSSTTKEGKGTYYAYDVNGKLDTISDAFGRVLTVKWRDPYSIASLVGAEASAVYNYESFGEEFGNPVLGLQRLTSVSIKDPDGTILGTKQYHYGDDWFTGFNLTGITDENNVRFATYSYDSAGKVVRSEHAGGADRHDFSYLSETSRIVTDPLGSARTYTSAKVGPYSRVTAINQPGGAGCGPAASQFSYDSQNKLKSRTDFNNNKTCFSYELARDLETTRTEGLSAAANCPTAGTALSAGQRRVSTQWHPDWPLATKVAEPLKIASFVYNGQKDSDGNVLECASGGTLPNGKPIAVLCKQIEQATTDGNGSAGFNAVRSGNPRVVSYNYNRVGQMLSTTSLGRAGSIGDTTNYAYYSDTTASHTAGDLWMFTSPNGKTKEFLEYTVSGFATKVREFNGQTSTFSYDARHQLTRRVTAAGTPDEQITGYQYDLAGQLIRVDLPDSTFVIYRYGDAHRLTDIADTLGNTIHYSLDPMGNRIKEETRDPSGVLTRQIVRVYDALNRVQTTSEGAL
jgi:YD repeat-containing protein